MNFEKNNLDNNSNACPIGDQTNRVLDEAKKLGSQIYEEGKVKLDDLQCNIKESSDKLFDKVHEKPLHSLLIAVGVGFLLSHFLKK